LYRGKIGVAKMAIEAGVPVVPLAMIGTFEVQPPGKFLPKIKRVGIRIGPPLDFSRYAEMADDRYVLRSITDQIMYEVMQLSGQEYVDTYAQRAREEIAAARAAAVEAAGGAHPDVAAVLRRRGQRPSTEHRDGPVADDPIGGNRRAG
nr:lysophospholipid acyltransferase family protein [Micromonospora sp. DSM 115978]